MRRTRWSAYALTIAMALVAVACEGGGATAPGGEGTGAAAQPTTVSITLSEFKIDPAMPEVPAGAPVTFEVSNAGQAPHTFGIVIGGQTSETASINPGETATLEVPPLEVGDYDILCTVPGHADLGMTGMLHAVEGTPTATSSGAPSHSTMTAEEMATAHEASVKAFAGQLTDGPLTPDHGGQPLKPTMEGNVKVFNLVTTEMKWEITKGEFVDAMAFNGQVPGPEIRVQPGDRVRFHVENQMTQPFVLHFHGLTMPNDMDGVPYITQPAIMPGESWDYEFTIKDPPGFYVYHSHFNSAEQVGAGLYGAIIVVPKTGWSSVYGVNPAVESTMFVGDGQLGYNINGKGFPSTLPIVANDGDWVLVHIVNEGELLHPMHLHGFHFQVVGQDGFPLSPANRYMADTLVIAPGQRFDILVHADNPGLWAFHCHILNHVEGPQGMFGMVTVLIVNK